MTANLPATEWRNPTNQNEFSSESANYIVDTVGVQLVDTVGIEIVDTGVLEVPLAASIWTEDNSL